MEISVNVFTTLDGVMQGPGGPEEDTSGGFDRGGWLVPFAGDAWGHVVDGWFKRGDATLLGRTTFEAMRGYWPQVTEDDDGVAKALNHGKKYLVSTTLSDDEAGWGDTTVIREDVLDHIAGLKAQGDGELQVHGSWQLAHSLHVAGLVDIFRILQFPVVLGSGKRLFGDSTPTGFDVLDASALPGGVVSLELRQTSHGSTDVGEYAVRDGKEVVV
jgi:dihydrofolate reductase